MGLQQAHKGVTMLRMTTERGPGRPKDRHKKKTTNIRLHPIVREQLEKLAARNLTTITEEITAAIRERLTANGLWPPPQGST